jgi:ferredoxin
MFNSYRENTLLYDPARCIGCDMCTAVCPHGVFRLNGRKAELQQPEDCMECGACALNCPAQALMVQSGVGCAGAMIRAAIRGSQEACC